MTDEAAPNQVADHDSTDREATGDPTPRGRRRAVLAAAVVVGVVLAALAAVALLGDDSSDEPETASEERTRPTPPPTVHGDIDTEGQQLLDLLEAGHALTYHAVYEVSGDPEVVGEELRLEVWRRDGAVRQDMRQITDRATVHTSSFLVGDEVIGCQRIDDGEWSCARQASGDDLTASGLFGNIARELEGVDVIATEEEVAGEPATCFSVTDPAGDEAEVSECVTAEGIPLRLRGGGAELLLAELSNEVPDDIFEPPAEPASTE